MAKETAPPTPVPMGDPRKDVIAQEGFCATIIDTKRNYQLPDKESSKIVSELLSQQ